ncbi:glycosyl hydrolase 43 family protein [Pedobacter aquae]|uniref:Glycosyl hydrolase 43 family protein n=1 Tax=Pedobacter aquae TaxID=2605747 RepID=A0A5C0VP10_9SPHI|nr:glycoside hydrolase 43 family protein [Pedobacter aquae]QEK53060.1 glycosyl hydrolase 43 family protein [Pedobacter aquae]
MNKKIVRSLLLSIAYFSIQTISAQEYVSKVWVADLGNGKYKNPVLNADYSDPDAIRVGDDFYMISSSFNHIPGLPLLHSKDLVNWTILTHVLPKQIPAETFKKVQHGNGVWAPAIRFHKNEYYIYYPDPDFGIYVTKASRPEGPWSTPELIYEGKGLIDPCPLWDEDGKTYLVHAYAGSRAGIKSVIAIAPMNQEGTKVTGQSVIVYDGHEDDPTIEGPKFYKRNGYYYIFAPAGGVPTGWQLILRSKNIYGPYERKNVLDQGKSPINGPHQGAWIDTQTGEDWFLHFQDKEAYGRVVHLQPMKWVKDWPVIGEDKDGDGKGEPVLVYKKPNVGKSWPVQTPAESDDFDSPILGKQWQWQANADGTWAFAGNKGNLRLYTKQIPTEAKSLWEVPNILGQKFPADNFQVTTKITFTPNDKLENEKIGLIILGQDYSTLFLKSKKDGIYLGYGLCNGAVKDKEEVESIINKIDTKTVYFRVQVSNGGICKWFYSTDNKKFLPVAEPFTALPGKWVGAKVGLYAVRNTQINDSGYADVDWFKVEPIK